MSVSDHRLFDRLVTIVALVVMLAGLALVGALLLLLAQM